MQSSQSYLFTVCPLLSLHQPLPFVEICSFNSSSWGFGKKKKQKKRMGLEETMKQRCYQHVSDKNQNICCTSGPRKHSLMLYCVSNTGQDGTFLFSSCNGWPWIGIQIIKRNTRNMAVHFWYPLCLCLISVAAVCRSVWRSHVDLIVFFETHVINIKKQKYLKC